MKVSKRRTARIRNELRQWLRSEHGLRTHYSRQQIDRGREELGFRSVDDALVAYTLFGSDLAPEFADSMGLAAAVDEINEVIGSVSEGVLDVADLLADN